MSTTTMTDRVLHEAFDTSRVIGKTLAELDITSLDWMGAYPIVEEREAITLPDGSFKFFDAPTQVVTGIVDANYPESFNDGNWRVVDDLYAVATEEEDEPAG